MACYRPLTAYQAANGAVVFTDNLKRHDIRKTLQLACGQCIGCRLERSRIWAARCIHHAQMHEHNAFVTLTYADEHLKTQSLVHRDFQLFMKRLRKSLLPPLRGSMSPPGTSAEQGKISYYMAGEYGSNGRRPHFHACIFGWQPHDKLYWRTTETGSRLYTSASLNGLWKKGFTSIGDVNFESAAYIARYIIAKQTGKNAWQHYQHINDQTGEITDLKPEYNRMSLKTPIGKTWLQKYQSDVYPEGKMLIRNVKTNTPKYYDKVYKKTEPERWEEMKQQRELDALQYRDDNTEQRLQAKERVKRAQINSLLRKI